MGWGGGGGLGWSGGIVVVYSFCISTLLNHMCVYMYLCSCMWGV